MCCRTRPLARALLFATCFIVAGPCVQAIAQASPVDTTRRSSPAFAIGAEERLAIEKALPATAAVRPRKPRRLLIFDRNVGYPGHPSISRANLAFRLMGKKTGAFEAVVHHDPMVFKPDSLRRFDAVFFNNTVGNLFEDPSLRRSLVEFVCGGGGLLGVHGTTVAFTRWPGAREDWPEFGRLLGARGARHRASDEHVFIKLDSPDHPLNRPFGGNGFDYRDEFFRVGPPYSRDRVRVLFSIDTEKSGLTPAKDPHPPEREDNDYALAWVRSYGRGRVFYSTIAHNPRVFADPLMLEFYLGAIQFALGDLPAPTLPSGKLTAAARAQEKLGWRLGVTAYSFHKYTFFEAIDKTAQLGIPHIGGLSFQKVSRDVPRNFAPGLPDDVLRQVRLKLDSAGVRLMTFYIHRLPVDAAACRKVFEFGRKLGIETLISEPLPEALDTVEKLCDEYDMNVAIHNHGPRTSPHCWSPEKILELCRGRSKRIGACGDFGYWIREGIDPVAAVKTLRHRLISVQIHDLHELGDGGHDVPWGTGVGQTERVLREIHRLGIRPTLFGLEYSHDWLDSMPEMARCKEFFDRVSIELCSR